MSTRKSIATKSLAILCVIALVATVAVRLIPARRTRPETINTDNRFLPPPIPPETYIFRGKGNCVETHIPFHFKDRGEVVVNALINGVPTKCMVDTGCSTILWVSKRHLTDRRTGFQWTFVDAGNNAASSQEALLDRIQLGGFELQHMLSYVVAANQYHSNALPILGNSVFAQTVLIIDCANRELIIRPSVPSSTPLGVQDRGHSLDFWWVSPSPRGQFGVLCVQGEVMSLPVNVIVDTGLTSKTLGLARSSYNQLLPQLEAGHIKGQKETINSAFGKAKVITISQIAWSLGHHMSVTSPAVIINSLNPEAQAALGWDFLKYFRTTINYPNHKIWFDPIPAYERKH